MIVRKVEKEVVDAQMQELKDAMKKGFTSSAFASLYTLTTKEPLLQEVGIAVCKDKNFFDGVTDKGMQVLCILALRSAVHSRLYSQFASLVAETAEKKYGFTAELDGGEIGQVLHRKEKKTFFLISWMPMRDPKEPMANGTSMVMAIHTKKEAKAAMAKAIREAQRYAVAPELAQWIENKVIN